MTTKKKTAPPPTAKKMAGTSQAEVALRVQLFVSAMLTNGGNATNAAISAGYSEKTAGMAGSRMMHRPDVKEALEKAATKVLNDLEVTNERIIAEYAKVAFLDPRRFYDEKGQLIAVNQLPADVAAALSGHEAASISAGKDAAGAPEHIRTTKIKLSDKLRALDSLARISGMFKDTVKVEVVSYQEKLQKARERANRNR